MAKKIPGLAWLDNRDKEQIRWAAEYLRKRGTRSLFTIFRTTYADLQAVGNELEDSPRGLIVLNAMKNAWRQKQYRDPHNGRTARTFSLPSQSIKSLSRLSNNNGHSDTDQLRILIDQASELHLAARKDLRQQATKEKASRQNERQRSARLKMQLDITTEHLERCLSALAKWELSMMDTHPPFGGDEAEAEKLASGKMRLVKREIQEALLRLDIATPRAVLQ